MLHFSRLACAVHEDHGFVRLMQLSSFMWTCGHACKLVWLCVRRSVGQHAIQGMARPAVVPCTRSVQLPGVLYTPATIQVRSMVVTHGLGIRQSTFHEVQIQGLHACVHGLSSTFVNAAFGTCMSHLPQCRACSHVVVCSQRMHRRL